jgi:hypothetical protein
MRNRRIMAVPLLSGVLLVSSLLLANGNTQFDKSVRAGGQRRLPVTYECRQNFFTITTANTAVLQPGWTASNASHSILFPFTQLRVQAGAKDTTDITCEYVLQNKQAEYRRHVDRPVQSCQQTSSRIVTCN